MGSALPDAFKTLRDAWLEIAKAGTLPEPQALRGHGGTPAHAITAVGLEGPAMLPFVGAASPSDVPAARAFAASVVSGPVAVRVRPPVVVAPWAAPQGWGIANGFPGVAIGGKSFRRVDGGLLHGGTQSLALLTEGGATAVLSNLHTTAPARGAGAPSGEFDLLEVTTGDVFARVRRWKQLSTRGRVWPNLIDAGVGILAEEWRGAARLGEVAGLGRVVRTGEATPGDVVAKQGATTGLTRGRVRAIHVATRVRYGWPGAEDREFIVQGCTEVHDPDLGSGGPFSRPGDSGSPVVRAAEDGLELVGLLFAGGGGSTMVCGIEPVLQELGLRLPEAA